MTIRRRKVLGVGFGKTGTSTFGLCMHSLGYRHLTWRAGLTRRILMDGDTAEMERLMERFESFDDAPWSHLYREMDSRYSDARFVLTVRKSSEAWFDSLKAHCARYGGLDCPECSFGDVDPVADPVSSIAVYERHNRDVREYFAEKPGKLLEVCWEKGDGWKELCGFLGEEIPDRPFPHVHKRPSNLLQWKVQRFLKRCRRGVERRLGS